MRSSAITTGGRYQGSRNWLNETLYAYPACAGPANPTRCARACAVGLCCMWKGVRRGMGRLLVDEKGVREERTNGGVGGTARGCWAGEKQLVGLSERHCVRFLRVHGCCGGC